MASTLTRESNAIFKVLKDNSGSFIKLEEKIDNNTEYMLKEIDIITGQLESIPYPVELGKFISDIRNVKTFEQKINTPSELGVLYYINQSEYQNIKSSNTSVTNISKISTTTTDHRIDTVNYAKLGDLFKYHTPNFTINTSGPSNGTLKPVKKATPTLTSIQQNDINNFNNQLQTKISEFNKLDAARKSTYTTAANNAATESDKNAYVDAHEKAIILYEVCKELVKNYNDLLAAINGKIDNITSLNQQTNILLPDFDILTPISLV